MNNFNPQAKLLWHGERIQEWLETGKTTPIMSEIMPTGYCNAKCPFCFFAHNRGGEIKKETMFGILNEMGILGVKAINWSGGGEPTLHPNFYEFAELANKLGIKQGLYTNAYNKIKKSELFEWIRITLTDKEFEAMKIPDGKCVGVCVNQTKDDTYERLEKLCIKAKKLEFDYFQIRPALEIKAKNQPKIEPPLKLKEHETKDFRVIVTPYKYKEAGKPFGYSKCYGFKACTAIDWNGHLIACPYMGYDERFVFADLNKVTYLEGLQKSPEYVKVASTCQHCCKNHEINKVMDAAKKVRQKEFL